MENPKKTNVESRKRPRKTQPIHEAALALDLQTIRKLLDEGADPNARNEYKMTPLISVAHFALTEEANQELEPAISCTLALIEKGASTKKRTVFGSTFWHILVTLNNENILRGILQAVKEHFPAELNNVWTPNLFGETIFHFCAAQSFIRGIDILATYNPPINAEAFTGHSALDVAMAKHCGKLGAKQPLIVKKLLTMKCKPGAKKYIPPVSRVQHSAISDGYVVRLIENDAQGPGATWANALELFYFGKKPKRGLALEISAHLRPGSQPVFDGSPLVCVSLVGMVRSVESDSKITATVKLLGSYSDKMAGIMSTTDEFIATLEIDYDKQNPWVLTALEPLPETDRAENSIRALEKFAAQREVSEGRRYPFKHDYCAHLKGDEHSHDDGKSSEELAHEKELEKILGRKHEHRVIDAVLILPEGLFYRFVPDAFSPDPNCFELMAAASNPSRFFGTIRRVLMNNVELLETGKVDVGAKFYVGDRELSAEIQKDLVLRNVQEMAIVMAHMMGFGDESEDSDNSVGGTGA